MGGIKKKKTEREYPKIIPKKQGRKRKYQRIVIVSHFGDGTLYLVPSDIDVTSIDIVRKYGKKAMDIDLCINGM